MTAWRNRFRPAVLRKLIIVLIALTCVSGAQNRSFAEGRPDHEQRIALELSSLGRQGATIARARGQVLEILQHDNGCTDWFKEADPDPAELFRTLHFGVEESGPAIAYAKREFGHGLLFKHPWGASATQRGGADSVVILNANGPFFKRTSLLVPLGPGGMLGMPSGSVVLVIASYPGDTPEAQITILLHELGHIIGRLPEDDDSWDGRSPRNTSEVLRHCKAETRAVARTRLMSRN